MIKIELLIQPITFRNIIKSLLDDQLYTPSTRLTKIHYATVAVLDRVYKYN